MNKGGRPIGLATFFLHKKALSRMKIKCFYVLSAFLAFPEFGFSWELSAGFFAGKFQYEEREGSAVLLEESGVLPGLFTEAGTSVGSLSVGVGASYWRGVADYSGATQSGQQLHTKTDERFKNYWLRAEYFFQFSQWQIGPRAGVKEYSWDRSIRSTENSLALNEAYNWHEYYMGLGLSLESKLGSLEIAYDQLLTSQAKVIVNLQSLDLGSPSLELGKGNGRRVSVGLSPNLSASYAIKVHLTYEEWDFRQSNVETIVNAGSIYQVQEPASKSNYPSLSVQFVRTF